MSNISALLLRCRCHPEDVDMSLKHSHKYMQSANRICDSPVIQHAFKFVHLLTYLNLFKLWAQTENSILQTCTYVHCVSKKYTPWCLIITLANVDQFSKFFHQLIRRKILYVYTIKIFISPAVCCYTTLWSSKIEKYCLPSRCKDSKAWSGTDFTTVARHWERASLQQWNENRYNVHWCTVEIFQQQPMTFSDSTQQRTWLPYKLAGNISASVCTNQCLQTHVQKHDN